MMKYPLLAIALVASVAHAVPAGPDFASLARSMTQEDRAEFRHDDICEALVSNAKFFDERRKAGTARDGYDSSSTGYTRRGIQMVLDYVYDHPEIVETDLLAIVQADCIRVFGPSN